MEVRVSLASDGPHDIPYHSKIEYKSQSKLPPQNQLRVFDRLYKEPDIRRRNKVVDSLTSPKNLRPRNFQEPQKYDKQDIAKTLLRKHSESHARFDRLKAGRDSVEVAKLQPAPHINPASKKILEKAKKLGQARNRGVLEGRRSQPSTSTRRQTSTSESSTRSRSNSRNRSYAEIHSKVNSSYSQLSKASPTASKRVREILHSPRSQPAFTTSGISSILSSPRGFTPSQPKANLSRDKSSVKIPARTDSNPRSSIKQLPRAPSPHYNQLSPAKRIYSFSSGFNVHEFIQRAQPASSEPTNRR